MSDMDGTKALDPASLPFGQGSHTASCKSNIISERERFFAVQGMTQERLSPMCCGLYMYARSPNQLPWKALDPDSAEKTGRKRKRLETHPSQKYTSQFLPNDWLFLA